MKYFMDTEFRETPNTIDLISIGIVGDDNSEYYAINKDVNLERVYGDLWLRENVLLPIYQEYVCGDIRNRLDFNFRTMRYVFNTYGKSIKQIASDIKLFCQTPEFYGYYADYDWVVFCWIFGRMIDLPHGFPMYCRDLKQIMDENGLDNEWKDENCPLLENEHNALSDARWNRKLYWSIQNYLLSKK